MSDTTTKSPSQIKEQNASDIAITPCAESRLPEVNLENPGFGSVFSDHMFSMEYHHDRWQNPEIIPFDDVSISPAMATLHYGQTVFEGMKAFYTSNDTVEVFRPKQHFERLNQSCQRLCIPQVDPDQLLEGLEQLISLDRKWVPNKKGNAFYIRPIIFATDNFLGVRPSRTYRLLIITSPVGAYYDKGVDPVSLTTTSHYVRAASGGAGSAKTACNYGPALLPAQQAKKQGYTQVLWLDARDHRYIEEVGTMNIFFKIDGKLISPAKSDSILEGITRDSVIKIAKKWGVEVQERPIDINEIFRAYTAGTLEEAFGTGTAAVISPVGRIHHDGRELITDEDNIGPFAAKVRTYINGIQYGNSPDEHSWMHAVC